MSRNDLYRWYSWWKPFSRPSYIMSSKRVLFLKLLAHSLNAFLISPSLNILLVPRSLISSVVNPFSTKLKTSECPQETPNVNWLLWAWKQIDMPSRIARHQRLSSLTRTAYIVTCKSHDIVGGTSLQYEAENIRVSPRTSSVSIRYRELEKR